MMGHFRLGERWGPLIPNVLQPKAPVLGGGGVTSLLSCGHPQVAPAAVDGLTPLHIQTGFSG